MKKGLVILFGMFLILSCSNDDDKKSETEIHFLRTLMSMEK